MPFSNAWSTAIPSGASPANTIDESIRQLRLDLEERIEAALITDLAADPLVPLPAISGKVTGKEIYIPAWSFVAHNDFADTVVGSNLYINDTNGGATFRAPLVLPVGCQITRAVLMYDNRSGGTTQWNLQKSAFGLVASLTDVFALRNITGTGIVNDDSGALTETIAANSMYFVNVAAVQGGRIYGVKIVYDTPDCRNTL